MTCRPAGAINSLCLKLPTQGAAMYMIIRVFERVRSPADATKRAETGIGQADEEIGRIPRVLYLRRRRRYLGLGHPFRFAKPGRGRE